MHNQDIPFYESIPNELEKHISGLQSAKNYPNRVKGEICHKKQIGRNLGGRGNDRLPRTSPDLKVAPAKRSCPQGTRVNRLAIPRPFFEAPARYIGPGNPSKHLPNPDATSFPACALSLSRRNSTKSRTSCWSSRGNWSISEFRISNFGIRNY